MRVEGQSSSNKENLHKGSTRRPRTSVVNLKHCIAFTRRLCKARSEFYEEMIGSNVAEISADRNYLSQIAYLIFFLNHLRLFHSVLISDNKRNWRIIPKLNNCPK